MPIKASLLERIKANDPLLKTLDLHKNLDDHDIHQLVNALTTNTTLTILDISSNRVGDEGAKALAVINTLTSLYISHNRIGDEGAKALAANNTLTLLAIDNNRIGHIEQESLIQAIARNNQQMVKRRDQFIQAMITLARNSLKGRSTSSLWNQLPREIMLTIIYFVGFYSCQSIGKRAKKTLACATFIFDNILALIESLQEAIKTQQDFKIIENTRTGSFRFFPPQPQKKQLSVNILNPEEVIKQPNELKKYFKTI